MKSAFRKIFDGVIICATFIVISFGIGYFFGAGIKNGMDYKPTRTIIIKEPSSSNSNTIKPSVRKEYSV